MNQPNHTYGPGPCRPAYKKSIDPSLTLKQQGSSEADTGLTTTGISGPYRWVFPKIGKHPKMDGLLWKTLLKYG